MPLTPTAPDDAAGIVARRRGRPRDASADSRILAAATELLLERGFEGTTVDQVALRAKVGKATVYRRWARKEDLAVAAMDEFYSRSVERLDTGSLAGDLRARYTDLVVFAGSPAGAAYLRRTIAEAVRDPRIAALHSAAQDRIYELDYEMFRRAQDRGEIPAGQDLRWAVEWLNGVVVATSITGGRMPNEQDMESLVAFVLHGVGATRA